MSPWIKIGAAASLALACYAFGHHVAALAGNKALADKQSAWDGERATLASQRADAINARLIAEQKRANAISEAAQNYEKGKADAEEASKLVVADVRSGAIRLRDQWATCQATNVAVSSAASGQRPDGEDRLREASVGRILRAVGQCQAQRDALQEALVGERAAQ